MPDSALPAARRSFPFFYGWVIMALAFTAQLFSTGLVFYAFGIFLGPLSDDFGWGKAETALGFSLYNVSAAFFNPFIGRRIDRDGPKGFLVFGCLLLTVGLLALTAMSRLWHFYALMFGVVGLGGAAMGNLPTGALLNNWFVRHRSFAIAVSSAGVSLGGVLVIFFGSRLIADHGWRAAMRALSAALLTIVLYPTIRWLINRPEDMGLHPDGAGGPPALSARRDRFWSTDELLRTGEFWRFTLVFGVSLMSLTGVLVFLKRALIDSGYDPWVATRTFGGTAVVGVVAKPLLGRLGDRMAKRNLILAALLCQMAAVAVLLIRPAAPAWLFAFSLLFGIGMSANLPIFSAWIADFFGRVSYARAVGLLMPSAVLLQMGGHYLGGKLFDRTGEWAPTLLMYFGAYLVTFPALFLLPPTLAEGGRSASPGPQPTVFLS